MGSGAGKAMEPKLAEITKDFPVRAPCLPGDVLVSGDLPEDMVEKLAEESRAIQYAFLSVGVLHGAAETI